MIRNVAELLKPFIDQERKKLDDYKLSHGPTIGAMYEGLTKELLQRAIPEAMGLQVVSGFVYHGETMSGQIDCMLVSGAGEQIPYTDQFKWQIRDVIAVLEVKKTLSVDELSDGYDHLRQVSRMYGDYVQSLRGKGGKVNISWVYRIFSQMTGRKVSGYAEVKELPFDLEILFHTLVNEFLEPVRIVVGHHGWKKEETLRTHVYRLLEDRKSNPHGMGAGSFPQLIIGGAYSIVKANGLPYAPALYRGMWPFLLSSSHNPVRILLELLFTKLDFRFDSNLAEDDSLERECMSVCLSTKAVQKDGKSGWEYQFHPMKEKDLRKRGSSYKWAPVEITDAQHAVFVKLCTEGHIALDEASFEDFAREQAGGFEGFIESLVKTQLIAIHGKKLVLTTIKCQVVVTPEGVFAAENHDGQLTAWMHTQLERIRANGRGG